MQHELYRNFIQLFLKKVTDPIYFKTCCEAAGHFIFVQAFCVSTDLFNWQLANPSVTACFTATGRHDCSAAVQPTRARKTTTRDSLYHCWEREGGAHQQRWHYDGALKNVLITFLLLTYLNIQPHYTESNCRCRRLSRDTQTSLA